MKEINLQIDGMKCSMCESHVTECIRKGLPSAKKISANHHKGTATFVVDDNIDYTPAIESIKKDGYRVLKDEEKPYEKKGFFSFFKK